jgi:hypothetical protein
LGEIKKLVGKTEVKKLLENIDVCGTIILKWVLNLQGGRLWGEFIWLKILNIVF